MCVCVLPLNKEAIDCDFIMEVKVSIKHVINLDVKTHYKILISIDVITFVTYHLKGSLSF